LKAIDYPILETAQILVEACSFAGTGNVFKIQAMLHHCDDHITEAKKESKEEKKDPKEEPKPDTSFPSFAVIAIALIAMGEDIGAEMSLWQFNHLVSDYHLFFYCANLEVFLIKMLYGEPTIRKLFHSLLDSSALQILTFPSVTHYLNTATTMTFKLPLTQYLPWGLLAQARTTLAWPRC
jgi:hypothetical protein